MKRVIRRVDPSGDIYDETLVINQYYKYRVDKVLDMVYVEECKESAVAFFSHLYNNYSEYSEFAKLCIHLLTISPDSVECERAISNLNTLKKQISYMLDPQAPTGCPTSGKRISLEKAYELR